MHPTFSLLRDFRTVSTEAAPVYIPCSHVKVAQMVKSLPAMQETQVQSLGREDPLEEEMATHSSILAWKFHGQRGLAGYSPWVAKSWTSEQLTF